MAAASCGGTNPGGPKTTEIAVTAVSPNTGTSFGGTTLTITGTGFSTGVTVTVGGTPATDVTFNSSTSITAKTPAHIAGAAEVKVSAGAKSGTLPNAFTYVKAVTTANTPPVVSALTITPQRPKQPVTMATIGDRITLTVSVNDAETPAGNLTYEWTANPTLGTFTGTGASVQWTAPATVTSAQTVLLLLTVVEKYQEADAQGLPINREHRIQQSAVLKVHDSVKEIGDMAVDFLRLFSDSSKQAVEVLHNFSQTCDEGKGYRDEFKDVNDHRAAVTITDYTVSAAVVTMNFKSPQACVYGTGPADACASVPVRWVDRSKTTGAAGGAQGTDYVSAVYESTGWRLCHSSFSGTSLLTGKPVFIR
jgi:hypothetical protein